MCARRFCSASALPAISMLISELCVLKTLTTEWNIGVQVIRNQQQRSLTVRSTIADAVDVAEALDHQNGELRQQIEALTPGAQEHHTGQKSWLNCLVHSRSVVASVHAWYCDSAGAASRAAHKGSSL